MATQSHLACVSFDLVSQVLIRLPSDHRDDPIVLRPSGLQGRYHWDDRPRALRYRQGHKHDDAFEVLRHGNRISGHHLRRIVHDCRLCNGPTHTGEVGLSDDMVRDSYDRLRESCRETDIATVEPSRIRPRHLANVHHDRLASQYSGQDGLRKHQSIDVHDSWLARQPPADSEYTARNTQQKGQDLCRSTPELSRRHHIDVEAALLEFPAELTVRARNDFHSIVTEFAETLEDLQETHLRPRPDHRGLKEPERPQLRSPVLRLRSLVDHHDGTSCEARVRSRAPSPHSSTRTATRPSTRPTAMAMTRFTTRRGEAWATGTRAWSRI